MNNISIDCGGYGTITVFPKENGYCHVESDLEITKESYDPNNEGLNSFQVRLIEDHNLIIKWLQNLVYEHCNAGVDISSESYQKGIEILICNLHNLVEEEHELRCDIDNSQYTLFGLFEDNSDPKILAQGTKDSCLGVGCSILKNIMKLDDQQIAYFLEYGEIQYKECVINLIKDEV